ncbi:hypothetical protein LG288_08440 [Idiomarina seosinensis]|uniref:hypothetical protein n=1 Tax=Idiomarina seosinensis TaxID=281739 RepID=UPI00384C2DE0
MQKHWHKQQITVLQAMNVPLYQLRSCEQDHQGIPSAKPEHYCYRLGPLLISAAKPLPVQLPQWLQDCCTLLETRPVAIKPATDPVDSYDFAQLQQQMLSAAGKQSFWLQLSKHL